MTLGWFGHFHLKAWAVLSKHHTSSLSSLFQTHCSISPHDPRCPSTSSFVPPVITSDHSISLLSLPSSSTSSSQLSSILPFVLLLSINLLCRPQTTSNIAPLSTLVVVQISIRERVVVTVGERGRNIRDKGNRIDDMKKKTEEEKKVYI